MRTTLNLDDDVLDSARALVKKVRRPLKTVINEALRAGLKGIKTHPKKIPYVTHPHHMGLKKGISLDQIPDLLAQTEGEDFR